MSAHEISNVLASGISSIIPFGRVCTWIIRGETKGSGVFISRSFRASTRPEGRLHPELLGHPPHPIFFTKWAASLHTRSE